MAVKILLFVIGYCAITGSCITNNGSTIEIIEELGHISHKEKKRTQRWDYGMSDYIGRDFYDDRAHLYHDADANGNSAKRTEARSELSTLFQPPSSLVSGEKALLDKTEKARESERRDILEHWSKILWGGLSKKGRDKVLTTLAMHSNLNVEAPKLNPKVASVMTDSAKFTDKLLEAAQNQLGDGIAGLADLMMNLIYKDLDKVEVGKSLSVVLQILLDLHYQESVNRRRLIKPQIDDQTWNMRKGSKEGPYLFYENVRSKKIRGIPNMAPMYDIYT